MNTMKLSKLTSNQYILVDANNGWYTFDLGNDDIEYKRILSYAEGPYPRVFEHMSEQFFEEVERGGAENLTGNETAELITIQCQFGIVHVFIPSWWQ